MTYQLHLGDCIEGMRGLPDKSVDHVIADPEYSDHVHANVRTNKRGAVNEGTGGIHAVGFAPLTAEKARQYAEQYARVCRGWVVLFCTPEMVGEMWKPALEAAGLDWIRTGIWIRKGAPQMTGDRPAAGCEAISIAGTGAISIAHQKGRKRWNGGGKDGIWYANIPRGDDRYGHETPKPVDLLRQLVADFTDPGELILDSHAGSGTTGAACLELGRRFIGWELDPKHYATASKRLAEASKQQPLFRVATTQEQARLPL
jgi:site-specific DNA-methyltransferase (adenine-specific)